VGDDMTVYHVPEEDLLRVSTTTTATTTTVGRTTTIQDDDKSAPTVSSSSSFHASSPNSTTLSLPIPTLEGSLASTLWPASCAASLWLARYGPVLFAASCRADNSNNNDEDTGRHEGSHHHTAAPTNTNTNHLRILELGSGLGLTGWMAAATAAHATDHATVVLTDHDEEAVSRLLHSPLLNPDVAPSVTARRLDWRDDHAALAPGERFDVVVGSDVAYYSFLLGPLRETVQHYQPHTFICVGPTHRTSLWDLYAATSEGDSYNSKTDRHEDAWPGTTRLMLYRLHHHSILPDDGQDTVEHEDMGVYVWTRHARVEEQLREWLDAGEMYAATETDKEGTYTTF
jgi:hypothetical protein